ncbi:PTS sugar transporter subunit IIA [Candidatus Auribacterota bacterium]
MNLAGILEEKLITADLKAKTKEDAIRELVHLIVIGKDRIPNSMVLETAVKDRELNGSTAIGNGICIPHARIDGLRDIFISVGISKSGISSDSQDKKKLQIFVLILCPLTKNLLLLQALAAISSLLKNAQNKKAFIESKKPADIFNVVKKSGIRIKKELLACDFMKTNIASVSPEMTLKEVVGLFFKKAIDSAPVLGPGDKLLGDLTGNELLCAGLPSYSELLGNIAYISDFEPFEPFFKQQNTLKVKSLYSPVVMRVKPETPLIEVGFKMVKEGVRRVYVVDNNDKFLGVIHRKDIITRVLYS